MKSKDDKDNLITAWDSVINDGEGVCKTNANGVAKEFHKLRRAYQSEVGKWPSSKKKQDKLFKAYLKAKEGELSKDGLKAKELLFIGGQVSSKRKHPKYRYDNFKITLYVLSGNIDQHLQHGTFKSERAYLVHWLENLKPESKPLCSRRLVPEFTPLKMKKAKGFKIDSKFGERDYRRYLIKCRDAKDVEAKGIDYAYKQLHEHLKEYRLPK